MRPAGVQVGIAHQSRVIDTIAAPRVVYAGRDTKRRAVLQG
jgi:hypothetical protein